MATLRLNILGSPQITLDESPINFESRKAVALLAYLAALDGRHTRAELATLLWPESDDKHARGALRYTLSLIKSTLGDGWLRIDRQQVGLAEGRIAAGRLEIDLRTFRRLIHRPGTGADIAHLYTALTLYRDDFLAGFTLRDSVNFEEWQFFQAEELRQDLVQVLVRLTHAAGTQGDVARAVQYARRLLHLDPLREDVQRDLMQLLARSGLAGAALQQYESFAAYLDAELGVAPSVPTQELYVAIRHDLHDAAALPQPEHAPVIAPNNLTAPSVDSQGRARELAAIVDLLTGEECRLLTIIGAGGMGKTWLAQQVGQACVRSHSRRFTDGVYFVPLAAVETGDPLIAAIAGVLGLIFSGPKTPLEQLQGFVQHKRILLILDNFEQLASQAATLSALLGHAAGLKLLITSRERLNLYDEWLFELTGLDVPDDATVAAVAGDSAALRQLRAYSAVRLFCQRARRINPHFQPDTALPAIVRICRLVDGMPLGIELAAGWVRVLAAGEIAAQIQQNLDFLVSDTRDVPSRHRSLRAVFRYSWQRLGPEEREVFTRLAVFRGGFDRMAVIDVAGASNLVLARLVDKSMIQRMAGAWQPQERYWVHETLRQFGWEELAQPARDDVCVRHAHYFARYLHARAATRQQAAEADAVDQIESEIDNVLAAWEWLVEQVRADRVTPAVIDDLAAAVPMLGCFLVRRARFREGQHLFTDAIDALEHAGLRAPPSPARTRLLASLRLRLAEILFSLSDYTTVIRLADAVLPLLQTVDAPREYAEMLWLGGTAHIRTGDYKLAEAWLADSLGRFHAAGEYAASTLALNGLGIAYSNQGQFDRARPYYEEYLRIAREVGYTRGIANALNNLGSNYARAGDAPRALEYYRETYELAQLCGEPILIAVALSNLGSVSRALQQYDAAEGYYNQSLGISQTVGERRWTVASLNGLGLTLVEMGDHARAWPLVVDALQTALDIHSSPDALDALAILADIMLARGQQTEGRAVFDYVANHKVTMSQARERSRARLQVLAASAESRAAAADRPQAGWSVEQVAEFVINCQHNSHSISRDNGMSPAGA